MEFLGGGWAEGEIEVHFGRCGCGCGGGRRVVGLDLELQDQSISLIITLCHSEIEFRVCRRSYKRIRSRNVKQWD